MFSSSQHSYKKISEALASAKKSQNKEEIKKSLLLFADTIDEIVSHASSYEILALFSSDPDMIFSGTHRELSTNKLETETFSTGYVDQLLDLLNISSHKEISDKISDSISDLHAEMSRSVIDIENKKRAVIESVDQMRRLL